MAVNGLLCALKSSRAHNQASRQRGLFWPRKRYGRAMACNTCATPYFLSEQYHILSLYWGHLCAPGARTEQKPHDHGFMQFEVCAC